MWYDEDWLYRLKITIPASQVASALSDFPVFIDLSALPPAFHANVNSDASDIRITTSDGSTELAREIVFYDDELDTGEVHFKATSLSSSVDNEFFIYYGNASASDYSASATYGSQNVWTNNYRAVWHANDFTDSTSNGRDLTNSGMTIVDGKVGKSFKAVGSSSQYASRADSLGLTSQSDFPITMSAWVKPQTNTPAGNIQILTIGGNTSGTNHRGSRIDFGGTTGKFRSLYGDNTANYRLKEGTLAPNADEFNHVVGVITANTNQSLYLNGADIGGSYSGTGGNVSYNTSITYLGRWNASYPASTNEFDEIRVSSGARTSQWILTEYRNQNNVHTFFEYGVQEWQYPPQPQVPVEKDLEEGELDIPEYTVELWSSTGIYTADVSNLLVSSLRINMPLNDVEQVDFTLDLIQFEEKCARIGANPINILDPYRTEVKIKRNGAYLLGTQVVQVQINLNNDSPNTIEVKSTGYLNLFKDRYITPGESPAADVSAYSNKTYAQLSQRLIIDTQSQDYGDFGVTLGEDNASLDQSMTRTREGDYDNQNVKDAILNLTKLENDNFDFKFTWDKRYECYTRIGEDKPNVELVYPQNIVSMYISRDASTLANKIIGIGSGIGIERLTSVSIDSTSATAYSIRERIELYNSTSNQSTLDSSVEGLVPIYKDIYETPTVELTNGAIQPGEIITGDAVLVRVEGSTFSTSINDLYRIINMTIAVSKDSEETITLKLVKWS